MSDFRTDEEANMYSFWYEEMLKKTEARQFFTSILGGPNIYWDGENWRLAARFQSPGEVLSELSARAILAGLQKGAKE